jgi:hypothetical protein
MKRSFCLLFLVVGVWSGSQNAYSSNFHEHYSSLTDYSDYEKAYKAVGLNLSDATLKAGTGIAEDCSSVLEHAFGIQISLKECETMTLKKAAEYLTGEFHKIMEGNPSNVRNHSLVEAIERQKVRFKAWTQDEWVEKAKEAFFEFNELNLHTPMSMEVIGWNVRTEVQKFLTQVTHDHHSGIYYLFKNYLDRVPLENRRVVTLSISANGFKGKNNRQVLEELRTLFKQYGTRSEFFVVWQRNKMITDAAKDQMSDLNSLIDQLERKKEGEWRTALEEKLIDGLDLVGSLHEGHLRQTLFQLDSESEAPKGQELAKRRERMAHQIDRVLGILKTDLQLKLHSWEKPKDGRSDLYQGEYYKVFKQRLEALAHKEESKSAVLSQSKFEQIRMGHIGGITSADIEYFKQLQSAADLQFVFEANIQSSINNHGVEISTLVNTVRELIQNGFFVLLGTDGAGIVTNPDAHYISTLELLKEKGLDEKFIQQIQLATASFSKSGYHSMSKFNAFQGKRLPSSKSKVKEKSDQNKHLKEKSISR